MIRTKAYLRDCSTPPKKQFFKKTKLAKNIMNNLMRKQKGEKPTSSDKIFSMLSS
jgi:hypothetical protein